MDLYTNKKRKYDIEDVNELLEQNIELASHIDVDVDKCIDSVVLKWLQNYNHVTSAQPLSLYYILINTIAHLSMESTLLQWNKFARHFNLYSIILGYSGVSKSGCVRECREALEELYDFLHMNNIGNPHAANSIIDKFTEAGFLNQLEESKNIIIIQEELDVALNQISFFSNIASDSTRQMFCQLYDALSLRKKTKGYQQIIKNARMTLCGTSTGVLLPQVLQNYLKHSMTDGADVRCLFLVLSYRPYLRQHHVDPNLELPTIAQILMAVFILGKRQYIYSEQSLILLDNYIERLSEQTSAAESPRLASLLAKQASNITRLTALIQIIDLLPRIFENIHITRQTNDTVGLNIQLFNEIDTVIKKLFKNQITINESSICKAIYFHGYLLEQTSKVFDISSLQSLAPKVNPMTTTELKQFLIHQILMLPQIIITKEDLYGNCNKKRIDRNIGTEVFESLVNDDLLYKDYFILTTTCRPIQCYAKVLPANSIDHELLKNKLQTYNIQISDYIDISRKSGIQSTSTLSMIGKQLFTRNPYSKVTDIITSISQSSSTLSQKNSVSSNDSFSVVPQPINYVSKKWQLNEHSSTLHLSTHQTQLPNPKHIIIRHNKRKCNSPQHESDMADDHDIITLNELQI